MQQHSNLKSILKKISQKIFFGFNNLSIKHKLLIIISLLFLISFSTLTIFSAITLKSALFENSQKESISKAEKYASQIKSELEAALNSAKTLSQALSTSNLTADKINFERKQAIKVCAEVLKNNTQFVGLGFLYKKNAFDGLDSLHKDSIGSQIDGQFTPYVYIEDGKIKIQVLNQEELPSFDTIESILEPYPFQINKKKIIVITALAPIIKQSKLVGYMGIDMNTKHLSKIITNQNDLQNQIKVELIGKNGIIASNRNQNEDEKNNSIKKNNENDFTKKYFTKNKIKNGISYTDSTLIVFSPFRIGNTKTDWLISLTVPIDQIMQKANKALIIEGSISLFFMLVLIIGLIFLINYLFSPLYNFIRNVEEVSTGKLNVKIETNSSDELGKLGRATQEMIRRLARIIGQINKTSLDLVKAGSLIQQNSKSVANGATNQASAIEEISTSIEELLAGINQNNINSKSTEKKANLAASQIQIVNKAFEKTAEVMETVTEKIQVINEIAAKTDLLAINAAIEAARAGEQGKGFAVVANEVRKLAEQSMKAAKEINQLSTKSVKTTSDSVKLLMAVIPIIKETANLVKEISLSTEEQNSGIELISKTLMQLTQVTQQNAESSENLAEQANVFEKYSKELKKVIKHLKNEK